MRLIHKKLICLLLCAVLALGLAVVAALEIPVISGMRASAPA